MAEQRESPVTRCIRRGGETDTRHVSHCFVRSPVRLLDLELYRAAEAKARAIGKEVCGRRFSYLAMVEEESDPGCKDGGEESVLEDVEDEVKGEDRRAFVHHCSLLVAGIVRLLLEPRWLS